MSIFDYALLQLMRQLGPILVQVCLNGYFHSVGYDN